MGLCTNLVRIVEIPVWLRLDAGVLLVEQVMARKDLEIMSLSLGQIGEPRIHRTL